MKSTYLVFDCKGQLRVATKEEWNDIMERNRTLPREQRRFFIQDCIFEDGEKDCIFIETTKDAYDEWHRQTQRAYRQKQGQEDVTIVSIDMQSSDDSGASLAGKLSDNIDWECRMLSDMRMRELRCALEAWKPWAIEMLGFYLDGTQIKAAKVLSVRHGVSQQTIRERKRDFEAFVTNFLK